MTLALIDGDIMIYKIACGVEQPVRWEDGIWTYSADENEGFKAVRQKLDGIIGGIEADEYLLCFSDTEDNYRNRIYLPYKSNRKGNKKPLILDALRNYCLIHLNCAIYPSLEADDVMGILGTSPDIEGDRVIVTIDKDLEQIPVPIYNMDTMMVSKPEHRECDLIVYRQCLTGDTVDGYPGCPGVGEMTAEDIIYNPYKWECYDHVFKSGKRKGLAEKRWRKSEDPCTIWEAIVSHYEKAGLTEDDALVQARCAYILQYQNYNDEGVIEQWTP